MGRHALAQPALAARGRARRHGPCPRYHPTRAAGPRRGRRVLRRRAARRAAACAGEHVLGHLAAERDRARGAAARAAAGLVGGARGGAPRAPGGGAAPGLAVSDGGAALRHQCRRRRDWRARRAAAERRALAPRHFAAHGGVHRRGRTARAHHLVVRGRGRGLRVPRRPLLGGVARPDVLEHPERPDRRTGDCRHARQPGPPAHARRSVSPSRGRPARGRAPRHGRPRVHRAALQRQPRRRRPARAGRVPAAVPAVGRRPLRARRREPGAGHDGPRGQLGRTARPGAVRAPPTRGGGARSAALPERDCGARPLPGRVDRGTLDDRGRARRSAGVRGAVVAALRGVRRVSRPGNGRHRRHLAGQAGGLPARGPGVVPAHRRRPVHDGARHELDGSPRADPVAGRSDARSRLDGRPGARGRRDRGDVAVADARARASGSRTVRPGCGALPPGECRRPRLRGARARLRSRAQAVAGRAPRPAAAGERGVRQRPRPAVGRRRPARRRSAQVVDSRVALERRGRARSCRSGDCRQPALEHSGRRPARDCVRRRRRRRRLPGPLLPGGPSRRVPRRHRTRRYRGGARSLAIRASRWSTRPTARPAAAGPCCPSSRCRARRAARS